MTEVQPSNGPEEVSSPPAAAPQPEKQAQIGDWSEIRVQGKLPERRSNHAAFIQNASRNYLFIHGGRDLKEGALDNLWRIDLDGVAALKEDPTREIEWEPVRTTGQCPGGQQGEDDNPDVYSLDLKKYQWGKIKQEGDIPEPRDDHTIVQIDDFKYLVFGGFVSGSRRNDVYQFEYTPNSILWQELYRSDTDKNVPAPRSSHSASYYNGTLFIYGGEDMEHVKLDDLWAFDTASKQWREIDNQGHPGRSGHSCQLVGSKSIIFGGILEVTKELNDMLIFDCATEKMTLFEGKDQSGSPAPPQMTVKTHSVVTKQDSLAIPGSPGLKNRGNSTMKHSNSTAKKSGFSPSRKGTMKAQGHHHQATAKKEKKEEEEKTLTSPTSLQMASTFIIKNADASFDTYFHQMKRRKQGPDQSFAGGNTSIIQSKFGLVKGKMPTARDGHSATVDKRGQMYVFGGDRHHMPFNDLYVLPLQ